MITYLRQKRTAPRPRGSWSQKTSRSPHVGRTAMASTEGRRVLKKAVVTYSPVAYLLVSPSRASDFTRDYSKTALLTFATTSLDVVKMAAAALISGLVEPEVKTYVVIQRQPRLWWDFFCYGHDKDLYKTNFTQKDTLV